jgi:S1-C subfamily serine protease
LLTSFTSVLILVKGNSGGPAFNARGQVTGVAFCKNNKSKMDNVGYLIPADVVRAFLGRISNGCIYTLSPSVPYQWHPMENKSLRLYHQVPEHVHGILLVSVCESVSQALQKGDVLTMIDGKPVADDGQVCLRGDELIQHRYMLRGKRVDEPTIFTVFRQGKQVECTPCVLGDIPSICLRWASVDYQPDYLILGALVLLPLIWSWRSSNICVTRLVNDLSSDKHY